MTDIRNFETMQNLQGDEHRISQILSATRPHKSALNGISYQLWIYAILSILAASELTAAAFFYTSSLGLSFYISLIACLSVCFGYHFLLHNILTEMAEDWSFKNHLSSRAMLSKMLISTVLSLVLLLGAASFVNLIGKPSFIAYHELKYSYNPRMVQSSDNITASMLTNKRGKISTDKIEQLTIYTQSKANAENEAAQNEEVRHNSYTVKATDTSEIIGATAYILEAILLLLAFSIAKSKYAAVIHKIKHQTELLDARKQQAASPGLVQGLQTRENLDRRQNLNTAHTPTLSEQIGRENIGFRRTQTSTMIDINTNEQPSIITELQSVITANSTNSERTFEYGDAVLKVIRQKLNNYLNKLDRGVGAVITNKSVLASTMNEFNDIIGHIETTPSLKAEVIEIIEQKVKPLLINFQTTII